MSDRPISLPLRRTLLFVWAVLCCLIAAGLTSIARENNTGRWSPEERARTAQEFFDRITAEFKSRAERLAAGQGKAPDISCPFVESAASSQPKIAADWARFLKGDLGESGTTRWITRALKELETARKKLAAAEKPAAAAWDKKHKDGRKPVELPPEAQAFIYDIQVQARNLGVILDNSPSMRDSLPAVRAEITRRFAGARFVEVDGCKLEPHSKHWGLHGEWYYATRLEERNPFDPKWYLPAIPQEDIHYHVIEWKRDALAAIESMIVLMEVDALYWFCDFDDDIQSSVIQAIGELLEKHKVRLYVHSVKSNPPGSLTNIINRSGGKLTRAPAVFPKAGAEAPGIAGKNVEAEARPISTELVTQSVNQVVRLKGTIKDVSVITNYGRPSLTIMPAGAALSIHLPRDTFAVNESHARIRAAFSPGTRFEVIGRITLDPGDSMHSMHLESPAGFKCLPPDDVADGTPSEPPAAAVEKVSEMPRKPGTPAGPVLPPKPTAPTASYKKIVLSDTAVAQHLGQDVQFTARVEAVEHVEGGHVRFRLEGVQLQIGCMAKDRAAVIPVSGFRAGDLVTVQGRIMDLKGKPVLTLQRASQIQLSKVHVSEVPGTGGRQKRVRQIHDGESD